MKKILSLIVLFYIISLSLYSQTKMASQSAALTRGLRTVELVNELNIIVDFDPEKERIFFTGNTSKHPLFISEYIPLSNPNGTGIELGKSYKLDNLFVSIEYKVLDIKDNKVTRIWYRVAAIQLKLPEGPWI